MEVEAQEASRLEPELGLKRPGCKGPTVQLYEFTALKDDRRPHRIYTALGDNYWVDAARSHVYY